MTYFCITINAHPHSGWFCVKHYLISLKRISIALHGLKPHKRKQQLQHQSVLAAVFVYEMELSMMSLIKIQILRKA